MSVGNIKLGRQMGFHREGADGPVSPERTSLNVYLENQMFHFIITFIVAIVIVDIFTP
jgi:hypothetical protein